MAEHPRASSQDETHARLSAIQEIARVASGERTMDETSPLLQDTYDPSHPDSVPLYTTLSPTPLSRVEDLQSQRHKTLTSSTAAQLDSQYLLPSETAIHRPSTSSSPPTLATIHPGSTPFPQTTINSAILLIGIGLLALPLAFTYTGWILGFAFLLLSTLVTKYTAALLAKTMDVDPSLANFGDIAFVAFGGWGRSIINGVIVCEMGVTCVGLVVIFADSVQGVVGEALKERGLGTGDLIQGVDEMVVWKVVCGVLLAPLTFVPMRWLGYTSLLGMGCNLGVLAVAVAVGLGKEERPGSLREVEVTSAWPERWSLVPLSFGLVMALWTGHSVFPNLYREMREPQRYGRGLSYVFNFVNLVNIAVATIGYLLFGSHAKDEFTTNILTTEGYPFSIKVVVLVLIAIVPITKFPLQSAPIISILEVTSTIDPRTALLRPTRVNQSRFLARILRAAFRLGTTALITFIAVLVPNFEVVAGVLGGFFGYLICVIVPIVFHWKMFAREYRWKRKILDGTILGGSIVLGIMGTVWEFLPRGAAVGEVIADGWKKEWERGTI